MQKDFCDLKIDDIVHNWEACMHLGSCKSRKKVAWCSPVGVLKFNVDSVVFGKPERTRVGRVLRKP